MHTYSRGAAGALVVTAALALSACSGATPAETEETTAETYVVERAKPAFTTYESGQNAGDVARDDTVVAEDVEIPLDFERVVVLDPAALDTLSLLGATDRIVGTVSLAIWPEYLSEYSDLPSGGTFAELDFEAIAALEPDLIITAARTSASLPELEEIATTIDLTAPADMGWFEGVNFRIEQLGDIFGVADEAAEVTAGIDEKISQIQGLTADAGTGLFISAGGGEITASGPGEDSRFGWVYDELGVEPVLGAEDLEAATHGDPISFEFLLEHDPDWLYVFDRDASIGEGTESAEQTLDNEIVAQTTAGAEGQIVYFDSISIYIVQNGAQAVTTDLDNMIQGLEG